MNWVNSIFEWILIYFNGIKNLITDNAFKLNFFIIKQINKDKYLIFYQKLNLKKLIKSLFFFDYLLLLTFSIFNYLKINNNKNLYLYRKKNTSWSFYKTNNPIFLLLNNKNLGLQSSWNWMSSWLLSIGFFFIYIYYLSYIKTLIFTKAIFIWFLVIMFLYWLISGFVFFIKKYQFSKFTSVIQRFWKRSYIIFWSLESGVFIIFFYLTLNASAEPVYMYDQMKLYKTHLFSWRYFIPKLIFPLSLIIFGYYLKNILKWNTFSKQIIIILFITFMLIYIVWLEFYQFFHIINYYNTYLWKFSEKDLLWILDKEIKRTRIVNNYVTICLLAKFWHLIFIFVFWIFFVLRINEINRVRYFLLSANLQNFIILYLMTWLYMYPWLKFLGRAFLDIPFYWFIINARKNYFRIFFNDIKLFYFSFTNLNFFNLNLFSQYNFFYINKSSNQLGFLQFKKHYLRDLIFINI